MLDPPSPQTHWVIAFPQLPLLSLVTNWTPVLRAGGLPAWSDCSQGLSWHWVLLQSTGPRDNVIFTGVFIWLMLVCTPPVEKEKTLPASQMRKRRGGTCSASLCHLYSLVPPEEQRPVAFCTGGRGGRVPVHSGLPALWGELTGWLGKEVKPREDTLRSPIWLRIQTRFCSSAFCINKLDFDLPL